MVIANPIFDVVFKRLMENEKVAGFFIGTLLEQNIESLELRPQEGTYDDELKMLRLYRLDFIANIKSENGEMKKVLIEIQKSLDEIDLMRFRNYLAEQYKKEDVIEGSEVALPITTIYILGNNLPKIDTPCLKVERNYKDLINNRIIESKDEFIEKLTHDSFVVQIGRITGKVQTRLEKLLSIFEQANFVDDKKITKMYNHPVNEEEFKLITDILHYTGTDPEEKKRIEAEQEAWRTYYAIFGKKEKAFIKQLEDSKKILEENKKALDEKDKALDEKDKALDEKDKIIEELKRKLDGRK
ncbi:MAG: hypothetical protein KJ607_07080 [Bacteroidetes bacterium]|nr:hypothetical protein [Bacteroidota bacterium]